MSSDGLKSLEKMKHVLDCFSTIDRRLSVSDIAQMTGMPKSTTHRMILSLREIGFLDQDHRRDEYRLGLGLFQLGNVVLANMDIHKEATPFVESLTRAAKEPVHLCVFDGLRMIFVTHSVGGRVGKENSTTVIEASPCYCTGVGKAALAFQPEATVNRVIRQGLQPFTRNTISDPVRLKKELAIIRERGFSIDNGEMEIDGRCVAAPIRNSAGVVFAAMSVSSSVKRLPPERLFELAPIVIKHADALSAQLGFNDL